MAEIELTFSKDDFEREVGQFLDRELNDAMYNVNAMKGYYTVVIEYDTWRYFSNNQNPVSFYAENVEYL